MTATAPEPGIIPVTRRADEVAGPPQGQWTYEAYAALPADGCRYEVIDGVLYLTPAPRYDHQGCVVLLATYFTFYVQMSGLGWVVVAPFDVTLLVGAPALQPDVLVILNEHLGILGPARVVGAPDLVVEVTSASTATYDRRTKMDAYARGGVPEYWIADPAAKTVEVFLLEADGYRSAGVYQGQATLPTRVLPAFPVPVAQLFA